MKALRSPWVSGGLAALALAFVGYQVLGGLRGHSSTSSGEQPVPVGNPRRFDVNRVLRHGGRLPGRRGPETR